MKIDSLVAYPLTDAQVCIQRYLDLCYENGIQHINRAFNVKKEDAMKALGIDPTVAATYDSFRAYIGIASNDLVGETYKLFLVPVNSEGKDVILTGIIENNGQEVQYVYDFNTPCPNTCDKESPLYIPIREAK
jgi:hypothetical protein